jgi:hypothetical protein
VVLVKTGGIKMTTGEQFDRLPAALKAERVELINRLCGPMSEQLSYDGAMNGPATTDDLEEGPLYITTALGGTGVYGLSDDDLATYNADPDLWVANYFGVTLPDYYQWLGSYGFAVCGATTSKGKPCSRTVHMQCETPKEWLQRHRKDRCARHGGKTLKELEREWMKEARDRRSFQASH